MLPYRYSIYLLSQPVSGSCDRAALAVIESQMQEDPKKQGKEKKPDRESG